MASPLIAQGTLNRLRASVVFTDHSELNVTSPYLGRAGIRLSLEGESTLFISTMTGAVTSPEPYMTASLVMALLKSQPLSDAYKQRMELNALLGECTVRPDATPLSPYQLINCAIENVRELNFSGEDADYMVTIKGYYLVNSSLFDF
jgi:hypothetical protein